MPADDELEGRLSFVNNSAQAQIAGLTQTNTARRENSGLQSTEERSSMNNVCLRSASV